MRTILFTVLLLVVNCPIARADPFTRTQKTAFDRIAAHAMATQHIVGLELGIGRNGKELFARGYGLRDRSRHLPVTAQTIFPIGSITKQFTSTAVLLLAARGRIALDAPVARYLPKAPHASQITVRELLDQTSGLPDYLENKALLKAVFAGTDGPHSTASLVALVDGMPLHFKPGTKFEYSNTNYALAGMIVARVSGMPYSRFLALNIFKPLQLTSTQYMQSSVPSGPNATRGYNYQKGRYTVIPRYSMDWGNSAGALASNVADLIEWDGAYFGDRILPARYVRVATMPPAGIIMAKSKDRSNNLGVGYAFGWARGFTEGRPVIWHNGGVPGGRAMNLVFPRDGTEIVVLTNATDATPEAIAIRIARVLFNTKSR